MIETYAQALSALRQNADRAYNEFNSRIVNSDYETIGVRIPTIKKLVRSVALDCRDDILDGFFADKSKSFESVLFAGCLASRKNDYGKTREYLTRIVPLLGSWAHVDCITPCLRWIDADTLWNDFRYLLDGDGEYETRFYIMIMFSCSLDDSHIDDILETLRRDVVFGKYYIDMAAAWLLAECLVKYRDKTLPLFVSQVFPKFVHNKALQKARESHRVLKNDKAYFAMLKIK